MSKMPSNIYTQPFENSMYKNTNDDFDDDLFNHHLIERRGGRGPHKNSYKSLEKKQSKINDFNNNVLNAPKTSSEISINLGEDINSYSIRANIPGITKNDIKLELDKNRILTISGERRNINENIENINNNSNTSFSKMENKKKLEKENDVEYNQEQEREKEYSNENKNKREKEKEVESEADIGMIQKGKEVSDHNIQEPKKMKYKQDKFARSFRIPYDADLENIHAKLENGVVEIIFNKLNIFNNQGHII